MDMSGFAEPQIIVGLKILLRYGFEFAFSEGSLHLHDLDFKPKFPYRKADVIWIQQVRDDALLMRGSVENHYGTFFWDTGARIPLLFSDTIQIDLCLNVDWNSPKEHSLSDASRQSKNFRVKKISLLGFNSVNRKMQSDFRKIMMTGWVIQFINNRWNSALIKS